MSMRDLPSFAALNVCSDARESRMLSALVTGDLSPRFGEADALDSPGSYIRSRVSSLDWYKTGCSGSSLSFCSEICEFHAVVSRKDSFSSLSSGAPACPAAACPGPPSPGRQRERGGAAGPGGNLVVSKSRTSSPAVSPSTSLRLPSLSLERSPSRKRSLASSLTSEEAEAWTALYSPRRKLAATRATNPGAAEPAPASPFAAAAAADPRR